MAVYCDQQDLIDRLGTAAVTLRTATNPNAVTDAIALASAQIDEFLFGRYGGGLVDSNWVNRACTTLAAVALTQNQANPAPDGVLLEYDRLMGTSGRPGVLERMRLGQVNLPDAGALGDVAPAVTNYHVDETTYGAPVIVAERSRGTDGRTAKAPRQARYDPLHGWTYG